MRQNGWTRCPGEVFGSDLFITSKASRRLSLYEHRSPKRRSVDLELTRDCDRGPADVLKEFERQRKVFRRESSRPGGS